MPTVILNKSEFEKLAGKKLPLDKLKDRISMLGTDLEKIEGNEIHVEIFPNRPDLLSEQGFARAFSSFIGVKTGLRNYSVKKSNEKVIIEKSVENIRPFTACAIVKNLKFDDEKIKEIIQIQEKLHITYGRNRKKAAIGIYPLEHIKPPIYYLAKKPNEIKFRPLEYPTELNGLQILQKHPTGREFAHLLEGKEKFPVFIDSAGNYLSMPPIINSHNVGKITEKTKDVFIECSGFDYDVLHKCLAMIVTALADMNGEIYSMELVYDNKKYTCPDLSPSKMKVDINYINKILGLTLKESEMKKLLEKMGFGYEKGHALVPCYRADVLHQIDLAEDIAIAYGYENFEEIIPKVATIAEEDKFEVFKSKLAYILIGLGVNEVSTYNLTEHYIQNKAMEHELEVIRLFNSISSEYDTLRAWMLPSLMHVLKQNKHNEYPQNIFEIGTIFKRNHNNDTNTEENDALCVVNASHDADFTRIKQILDYLMRMLNISYTVKESEHSSFIPGRIGEIIVNNKSIGIIGELSPKVLSNFELEMPVAVFELNVTGMYSVFNVN